LSNTEQLEYCHSGQGKFPHHSQESEGFITSKLTSLAFFRAMNRGKGCIPESTGWQNPFAKTILPADRSLISNNSNRCGSTSKQ